MSSSLPRKKVPIGISDYKKLVLENYYYVDKTELVVRVWDAGEVVLLPRPRRFGKTLNLSMLRYFFEKSDQESSGDHEALFGQSKLLLNYPEFREHMGKYPVISLTFKSIRGLTWADSYDKFKIVIQQEYDRHLYLLETLSLADADLFQRISNGQASGAELSYSLKLLSKWLFQYYNQRVIILIDEYDCPLHSAYDNGYYPAAVDFVRDLLSEALKDNVFLHRSFVTGILSIAKEGIFSGLNNIRVLNILKGEAADCFGFTHAEVAQLLDYYEMSDQADDVKTWYNGYKFGGYSQIYNPWSVLNCIKNSGEFDAYWANTSSDALIKKLLVQTSSQFKMDCELLLSDKELPIIINESIVMPELETSTQILWSLLFFSGYLTYESYTKVGTQKKCLLTIPNLEIKELFDNLITGLVVKMIPSYSIDGFTHALVQGDVEKLTAIMQEFISSSVSVFDIPQKDIERSYHLFVLGLVVALRDAYYVDSNRESGDGRYDIMLVPKEKSQLPIIIEFKKSDKNSALKVDAQKALQQIKDKKYAHALTVQGFKDHRAYGMAFYRKEVYVAMEPVLPA